MRIINKKVHFDYIIQETLEAGVALTGPEVKSLRKGHAQLGGAFVRLVGGEAMLVNAQIFPYAAASPTTHGYDPKRTRKLLLHKKELIRLTSKLAGANLTLVPIAWYTKGSRIKLGIGLARGKKQHQKREVIKRREQQRELEQKFRGKVK